MGIPSHTSPRCLPNGTLQQRSRNSVRGRFDFGPAINGRVILKTLLYAPAIFMFLGTLIALWKNPVFYRMVPIEGYETFFVVVQLMLLGYYFAIPQRMCPRGPADLGTVVTLLGTACPICNKILVLFLGAEFLMAYFDPIRLYVSAGGIVVTGAALWIKLSVLSSES